MKKLLLLFAVSIITALFCSTVASAQDKEKVVTGTVTLLSPSGIQMLDEYIAAHLYSGNGTFLGLNVKFGALYRKNDNLSWDCYYTSFGRPKLLDKPDVWPGLQNPAKSQQLQPSLYRHVQ